MAIKNFKGPSNIDAIMDEKILVSDYMVPKNKLVVFKPDQKMIDAIEILVKNDFSGAPVVSEKGELLGMLSEGDCMKKVANSRYYNIPLNDQEVKDYMESIIDSIPQDMNIFDVANLFCTARRNRFPVVENGVVIGQISRKDVLKASLEIKAQNW